MPESDCERAYDMIDKPADPRRKRCALAPPEGRKHRAAGGGALFDSGYLAC